MKQERANKKIKKGDIVQVVTGREAASKKTGKVLKILTKTNRCIVEKVNMVKVHRKPTQTNPQGGIDQKEASIHLSNVVLISKGDYLKSDSKKATKPAVAKTSKKKAVKG